MLLAALGCTKPQAPTTSTAPTPTLAPAATVTAAPSATATAVAAAPALGAPSHHSVSPKITLKRLTVAADQDRWEALATELPAISDDGERVALVGDDDTAKECRLTNLVVLSVSKKKIAETVALIDNEECYAAPPEPRHLAQKNERVNAALVARGNAVLAKNKWRTFDTGVVALPDGWRQGTQSALFAPALRIDVTSDDDMGFLRSMTGTSARGRAFALDLKPWAVVGYDVPHVGRKDASLIDFSTLAVDLERRVIVFQGTYMSVNTWLKARETSFVTTF